MNWIMLKYTWSLQMCITIETRVKWRNVFTETDDSNRKRLSRGWEIRETCKCEGEYRNFAEYCWYRWYWMPERPCDINLVSAMSILALELKSVFFRNERIYFNFELESQQLSQKRENKKRLILLIILFLTRSYRNDSKQVSSRSALFTPINRKYRKFMFDLNFFYHW